MAREVIAYLYVATDDPRRLLMSLCELVRHDRVYQYLETRAAELSRFFIENAAVTRYYRVFLATFKTVINPIIINSIVLLHLNL